MTIYGDDLIRITHRATGLSACAFGFYDAVAGAGSDVHGLVMTYCGAILVYTTGSFLDYLRRRDTQLVAYLAGNPGSSLPQISAATGLHEDQVGSSLQRLTRDGLLLPESGAAVAYRISH